MKVKIPERGRSMSVHTAFREFTVADGKHVLCDGEARYTFTVAPGRKAVTWASASGGFSPAERPSVDVSEIAVRFHHSQEFRPVDGFAFDMLVSDVPDAWFLEQIEEAEA
jgi:hypothetical protein